MKSAVEGLIEPSTVITYTCGFCCANTALQAKSNEIYILIMNKNNEKLAEIANNFLITLLY